MVCCRISTFPSHKLFTLAVYRSPNYTSSGDLLVLQAISHVATAHGEFLIVDAPAVDWSNLTCPQSVGFDKNLLTTAEEELPYEYITQSTRFRAGNRMSLE